MSGVAPHSLKLTAVLFLARWKVDEGSSAIQTAVTCGAGIPNHFLFLKASSETFNTQNKIGTLISVRICPANFFSNVRNSLNKKYEKKAIMIAHNACDSRWFEL